MTPESSEEQEAVRRALAATPSEGPMPPDVVARLEDTVAGLARERASAQPTPSHDAATPTAEVVALEERRRRRWPRVLVAAASVAVLGYGVGAVLTDLSPSADNAATEASAGGSAADRGEEPAAEPESALGGSTEDSGEDSGGVAALVDGRPVPLSDSTLRRDVDRLLDRRVAREGPETTKGGEDASAGQGGCRLPAASEDDLLVAVRLDGTRATLLVTAPSDGTRVAEVYACDDGRTVLARTRVPARR